MTTSPKANRTGQVAIAGSRSFIARALFDELDRRRIPVVGIGKPMLGVLDMSRFDCVYLVLGRARPNPDEEAAEREQLAAFLGNPTGPGRAVYISSKRVTESKRWCEEQAKVQRYTRTEPILMNVIRPVAVFGPDQDLDSEMLIPSLVRSEGGVELAFPKNLARFVSVNDLARHLANFADPNWHDHNWCGDPDSIFDVPGTFNVTPHEMRELYLAFRGLITKQAMVTADVPGSGA